MGFDTESFVNTFLLVPLVGSANVATTLPRVIQREDYKNRKKG